MSLEIRQMRVLVSLCWARHEEKHQVDEWPEISMGRSELKCRIDVVVRVRASCHLVRMSEAMVISQYHLLFYDKR
jgi:hypothetical protein